VRNSERGVRSERHSHSRNPSMWFTPHSELATPHVERSGQFEPRQSGSALTFSFPEGKA